MVGNPSLIALPQGCPPSAKKPSVKCPEDSKVAHFAVAMNLHKLPLWLMILDSVGRSRGSEHRLL